MLDSELSVLLVEDNPAEMRRLSELLAQATRCRMRVTQVGSIGVAKRALANLLTDVILLDWVLPDRYGVDGLRDLQAVAPRTPVLMLVDWDDDEAAMNSLRAGAQDVLIKERMTTSILERTIRYAVERKQTESALRQTEEMYRSLIESLPINVFHKDAQGHFVFANQRYCDELHKQLGNWLAAPTSRLFHRSWRRNTAATTSASCANGWWWKTSKHTTRQMANGCMCRS